MGRSPSARARRRPAAPSRPAPAAPGRRGRSRSTSPRISLKLSAAAVHRERRGGSRAAPGPKAATLDPASAPRPRCRRRRPSPQQAATAGQSEPRRRTGRSSARCGRSGRAGRSGDPGRGRAPQASRGHPGRSAGRPGSGRARLGRGARRRRGKTRARTRPEVLPVVDVLVYQFGLDRGSPDVVRARRRSARAASIVTIWGRPPDGGGGHRSRISSSGTLKHADERGCSCGQRVVDALNRPGFVVMR